MKPKYENVYFYSTPEADCLSESLHQACAAAAFSGLNARMVYTDGSETAPEAFLQYKTQTAKEIEPGGKTLFVIPDICEFSRFKDLECAKAAYWESPPSHPGIRDGLDPAKECRDAGISFHIVNSEYAASFLRAHGVYGYAFLADTVHPVFSRTPDGKSFRGKTVLVNEDPEGISNAVRAANPDISFVSIRDMSAEERLAAMDVSRVYLDLGPHSTRCDKTVREAVCRKLLPVLSRNGCALNRYDYPFDAPFKADADVSNIQAIGDSIRSCLDNYDSMTRRLEPFRTAVASEWPDFGFLFGP